MLGVKLSQNKEMIKKRSDKFEAKFGNSVEGFVISHEMIQQLEGAILTIVDASFANESQREALKSLFRNEIWGWASDYSYWQPIIKLAWESDGETKVIKTLEVVKDAAVGQGSRGPKIVAR